MSFYRRSLSSIINKWPGEKTFGIYRFLPLFFGLGAALEFSMINWTVGTTNFCKQILIDPTIQTIIIWTMFTNR